jgi:membrane fusion protein, multidrug efflux system
MSENEIMTSQVAPTRVEQPKATRWVLGAVGLIALIGAGLFMRGKKASNAQAAPAGSAAEARPIPVVVATVAERDVPVFLDGLGNAVPLITVTVKPQVDGPLMAVLFQEGQQVKKGDVLARIDPRPFTIALHQAQAALARDQAQAKNAKVNLTRYIALHDQGLATQEQLDDQRATAEQLTGTTQSDQAQIENAQLQLTYTEVRSPVDGVTGVRQVDQGNVVHAADANGLVVVTQLDPMAIVFTLPQDNLPQINAQIAGGLSIEAYSRDGDRLLGKGKLTLVDNQVSLTTATVRLKGIVPNPDKALWPNEFVRARLLLATRSGVLAIPAPAVQRGPQGTFVYIVLQDQTAALRTIDVDTVQDQWAVIKRGLNVGDQVVVEGQNQLRPGAKVARRSSVAGSSGSTGAPGATGDNSGDAQPGAAAKGKRGGAQP